MCSVKPPVCKGYECQALTKLGYNQRFVFATHGRHHVENDAGSSPNAACHYLSGKCKDLIYISTRVAKHTLMSLITELGFLYSSLASWADAYKTYVSGLHSWLQRCVVQTRRSLTGRRLILSPRQHLAPPLFVLLRDWSAGISSLLSKESWDSIKNLAADLKKMYKHHASKKMSSDIGA